MENEATELSAQTRSLRAIAAVDLFLSGYNCSQSVLTAFSDMTNIDRDVGLQLSTGFGAGLGRMQEVCGAVSGAVMVLGALHGRNTINGREATENTYALTQDLLNAFAKQHGTVVCREILSGCDLRTAEGQAIFVSQSLKNRCEQCVADATMLTEAILQHT